MSAATRSEVLSELRSHLTAAWLEASHAWWNSSQASILGSLDATSKRIERLAPEGDLGRAVAAGSFSHEKWIGYAELQWGDVNGQRAALDVPLVVWPDVWADTKEVFGAIGDGVATTVGYAGKALAAGAEPLLLPLFLVVAGLIALAVVRVGRVA